MALANVTLATLRTDLFLRVDTSRHWVNEEARIAINDVLKFWNLLTGQWRRTVTVSYNHPSGDAFIPVGGTMIWPMRMELSTGEAVHKVSFTSLYMAIPRWEAHTTSTGGAVPTTVKFWAPRSLQLLVVYPRPTATTSFNLDGVSETPVLVNDGDFVDLDEGLLEDVLDLAAHWLQFKDGGPKFFNTIEAFDRLVLRAGEINQQIRASTLYRRAQMRDHDRTLYSRKLTTVEAGIQDRPIEAAQQRATERP